jgi:23S rRNA (adenine-N6)-dimethyltransferase
VSAYPGRRGSATRRDWGWHPLLDSWARKLVRTAAIRSGDLVLDIGAGTGVITRQLLAAGATVIAVELHPGRADRLRERFGDRITVVQADAADLRLPRQPFRVVASPPFGISSALLKRLLSPGSRLESADLVLQQAVVRRFVDGRAPGAARWARDYVLESGATVPRNAFRPPPQVDCAVLRIRRRR